LKIRCLIGGDNLQARQLLQRYLDGIPFLESAGHCASAFEAIDVLQDEKTDLPCTKIEMPGLNGIDFLKTLRQRPGIVFVTVHPECALEGFQLEAVDYLLKPVQFDRLVRAANRARDRLRLKATDLQNTPPIGGSLSISTVSTPLKATSSELAMLN